MSESDDPELDLLKRCRLAPESEEVVRIDSVVRKQRRKHFVKVPGLWVERLSDARHIATYRVAMRVLARYWQRKEVFPLPNNIEGVSRWAKWAALSELEKLGLIRLERRDRKSPLITVVTIGDEDG